MAGRKLSEPWECPDCGKVTRFAFRLNDPSDVQQRQCHGSLNREQNIPCMRLVKIILDDTGHIQVVRN